MLKANLKKIKSAPNTTPGRIVILFLVLAVAFVFASLMSFGRIIKDHSSVTLRTDSNTYYLYRADTPEKQEKGLGGWKYIGTQSGMIFPYAEVAERCFWMKDMQFPIDIIWVGTDKRVTHIENDVSPSTYPDTFCHAARYVIELNAGEAHKNGLENGSKLNFSY